MREGYRLYFLYDPFCTECLFPFPFLSCPFCPFSFPASWDDDVQEGRHKEPAGIRDIHYQELIAWENTIRHFSINF